MNSTKYDYRNHKNFVYANLDELFDATTADTKRIFFVSQIWEALNAGQTVYCISEDFYSLYVI